MENDRRRSGERARSGVACTDFLTTGCVGISSTEVVEEELE
jgi:hypothetical protein